ncbi:hypothetical protein SAMN05216532_6476 [Streptomyces sp. 2231.1]|nr:hypothetical protein SAMN05216532_6476 [Streptomyces sp. 2231.1]
MLLLLLFIVTVALGVMGALARVENGVPEHIKTASNTTHQARPRTQKPPPDPVGGGSSPLLLSPVYHQQRRRTWGTRT